MNNIASWKKILESKQKCTFNSYIYLKKPWHKNYFSYVNENPIREVITAVFLDVDGNLAEGYEPYSVELDPGETVKFDARNLLKRDDFVGSSILIIRPVNENDTMIIKNKDSVSTWLSDETACEIGTAAFPWLNVKGKKENQSYYMFCAGVAIDDKRKTLIVVFNHSTESDYDDVVEFKPKLQNLNGESILGRSIFAQPFGVLILDTDDIFGEEGKNLLATTGGRGSITMAHRGHVFSSFFFQVDREKENLMCGSHTQPPMGVFMNPIAIQHYWLTSLASRIPFSTQIVYLLRKIKNYGKNVDSLS